MENNCQGIKRVTNNSAAMLLLVVVPAGRNCNVLDLGFDRLHNNL